MTLERKELRVGVAGCGLIAGGPVRDGRAIAGNHAAACRATPGVRLVAAADPDPSRLEAYCALWDVEQRFQSGEAMIAQAELDLLIVATPPESHEHLCVAAAKKKIPGVLCEKPFTGHAKTAQSVAEVCKEAGTQLAINFSRRWDDAHRTLAARLEAGAIGEVRVANGLYTGTLRGNGAHLVDLARFLVPGPLRAASARGALADGDGPIAATLVSPTGARVHLDPVERAGYFVFELDLVGTHGRARITLGGNEMELVLPAPDKDYPGYLYLTGREPLAARTMSSSFERVVAALAAAVRGEAPLSYTAADAAASLALLEEVASVTV